MDLYREMLASQQSAQSNPQSTEAMNCDCPNKTITKNRRGFGSDRGFGAGGPLFHEGVPGGDHQGPILLPHSGILPKFRRTRFLGGSNYAIREPNSTDDGSAETHRRY